LKNQGLARLVVLLLAALAGCRALAPAPPAVALLSGEELLSRLRDRYQNIQSFKATGRITFLSPRQNYSGTAILRGRFPDILRVDVLDLLGRTILSFATDGRQVQVLSPREGKLFRGPATPANLAAFIPPAVTLTQATRLLVGALPLSQGAVEGFEYEPARGQYRLAWRAPGGDVIERLEVAAQGLHPEVEAWYGGAPEPRFTARFSGFGLLAPNFPEKITLATAAPKVELRLTYSEIQLNPPLTPGDLSLQPPPGVSVVPLAP
jgi:hypothetical protein